MKKEIIKKIYTKDEPVKQIIMEEEIKRKHIEKQKEELTNSLRELAKSHLIKYGYDKNLIKLNSNVTDTKEKEKFKFDLAVLDEKTKLPIIIIDVQDSTSYIDPDSGYNESFDLHASKFDWPHNHLLNFNGTKSTFTIRHRIKAPYGNVLDFTAELDENEIKELKNITPQELFKIHREKYNYSYPIKESFFDYDFLRNHSHTNNYSSDFVNTLMLKYIDETKNNGKLFRGTNNIDEHTISKIFENFESFHEYEIKNDTNFQSCIKYFNSDVGELLRSLSISKSNPFELIKIISKLNDYKKMELTISKDIINFISEIQDIKKNSVVLLENLSSSTVFEHIYVIMEKLDCKIEDLHKFVNLFIIHRDANERLKIKFIFQVLGMNVDNIKSDFSELKIETKLNYYISLKLYNVKFSGNQTNFDKTKQYDNDSSKYEITNLIKNIESGTVLSFIVSTNLLFFKTKNAKLFRDELLKNAEILSIMQLPKKSLIGIDTDASLIILKKSSDKILNYKIFMSYIDKFDIDFVFEKKEIVKKYNEFKNKKSLQIETDLGFLVNTNELNENWSVFDKKPSQKKLIQSLKFSNPVHLKEVAKIIRPLSMHTKLHNIIRIRDIGDEVFLQNMIDDGLRSEKIIKDAKDTSLFEPGDILFSTIGTNRKTSILPKKIPHLGLGSGIVIIRPDKSKITSEYLKYVLDSKNTILQLIPNGIVPSITTSQISNIKIELIKLDQQKVTIKKINQIKVKIDNLRREIVKYENCIKKYLE